MKQQEEIFDIFLSYKNDDHVWVNKLKRDLQARGVKVWLDKDQIRPGDLFPKALEKGISSSKSVGLVITPLSMKSNWVQSEYSRALNLSKSNKLQLIPILLRHTRIEGFLADLQWIDFTDINRYEQNVDSIIWPGITGKNVMWYSAGGGYLKPWNNLEKCCRNLGISISHFADFGRLYENIHFDGCHFSGLRLVVVADIFNYWPEEGLGLEFHHKYKNFTKDIVSKIFDLRKKTKNNPDELVFLLFHHSKAWEKVPHNLEEKLVKRLYNYFTIHGNLEFDDLMKQVSYIWLNIQKDLLNAEHRLV